MSILCVCATIKIQFDNFFPTLSSIAMLPWAFAPHSKILLSFTLQTESPSTSGRQ